ncbi:MAG: hypothetical protein WBM50_21440 [Acidimicrobiales bacterium]
MTDRPPCDEVETAAWFAGRIPDGWFPEPVEVKADRDEILVFGTLATPSATPEGDDAARVAATARISGFREETRLQRMKIAEAAQARWGRTVSWVASCGSVEMRFTTASVPVMTRLRFEQRQVLDTLIDSGVVRSRSEGLAWCVHQVAQHQAEWIDRLKEAMSEVERIRSEGP